MVDGRVVTAAQSDVVASVQRAKHWVLSHLTPPLLFGVDLPSHTPGLPTVSKVVSRTPDPVWPAPDAPEVKKARTKPRPQQAQQQQQDEQAEDEQPRQAAAAAAGGAGASGKSGKGKGGGGGGGGSKGGKKGGAKRSGGDEGVVV